MSSTKEIPVFHPTFDFDTLMREAQKHITELAGDLWSDHNPSDPGITQLEVLAFCIADLSYRTSFDVKDILKGYKGGLTEVHDLPLANIALPNNPVTIKDLRKLLVDMPHPQYLNTKNLPDENEHYETKLLVRNAFPIISEANEVPFYAVSKYGKESFLTFDTSFEEIYRELEEVDDQVLGPGKVDSGLLESEADKAQSPAPKKELKTALHPKAVKKSVGTDPLAQTATEAVSSPKKHIGKIDPSAGAQPVEAIHKPFSGKRTVEFEFLDQIHLNGLYALQIEFEEDIAVNAKIHPHLFDLNKNFFTSKIPIGEVDYEISVLMPYWDDIRWSLKDVVLDQYTTLEFGQKLKYEYMIAVDKLNYDDYFYDYYAEMNLEGHKLPLFIKTQFWKNNNFYQGIPDFITVGGKNYQFIATFLDWNELSNGVNQNYNSTGNPHLLQPNLQSNQNDLSLWGLDIFPVSIEGELHTYDIKSEYTFKKERVTIDSDDVHHYHYDKDKTINLLTRITFEEGTIIGDVEESQIRTALLAKFPHLFSQQIILESTVKSELKNIESKIYSDYLTKINRVFDLLYGSKGIWSYLGKYRNLCEDFARFSASRVQEVALFGKLIVTPNHNINELLAEIYFRIDQFLNPLIKFWSLGEMVKKGYQFEDLFNGPLLENGFIEDDDLNNLKRRSVVYTSDLIRIIMGVPGVKAVEDFSISSYIDNRLMGRNVLNCLSLTNSDVYKPRFTTEKTRLEVWINNEKQVLDPILVDKWYGKKKEWAKQDQISPADNSPLGVSVGRDMEIENYYSIQHDFPEVYGIGSFGLPNDATEERRARAKQLKGYLLPFEQLLANYLKQIAHLPEIFSFSRAIDRTYHYQPLYNIPDVQPLLEPFKQSGQTWDNFKQDLSNAYMIRLGQGESDATFKNRRNRFLNHLLARFGESFAAYSTQMFNRNQYLLNDVDTITQYRIAQTQTLSTLIKDQISFAEDYPKVSGERYKAFDMTLLNKERSLGLWNNSNIGSYKRRLCRLLGIENVDNRFIFQTIKNDQGEWIDEEGMHIVEHILLRPRTSESELLKLKNEPISNAEGSFIFDAEKDPYSFRITIVLPRYANRFKEKAFRQFTERLIRMETPAHIRVDFRWMSGECGKKFETHYSKWKQNIYKLKPWLFRNIEKPEQIRSKELWIDGGKGGKLDWHKTDHLKGKKAPVSKDDLTKINYSDDIEIIELERPTSILTLQDNLVQALQASCELRLEAFNASDEKFFENHGKITFENGTTDVHHLRVNEIGGIITIYKLNRQTNTWESKGEFKPITQNYFDVNDFLQSGQGLTTEYGGRGIYKLVYEMEDRDSATVVIEVTKTIIKPNIYIGDLGEEGEGAVMLDFNTETNGVFRSSSKRWARHFLQFDPISVQSDSDYFDEEIFGTAYIESASKGLAKTKLLSSKPKFGKLNTISFLEIYKTYGAGTYHITYVLDGQITFADIELFLELSITVFNHKKVLLPNENGIIVVPFDMRKVNLILDLPGGGLTVYDLDATVSINNNGSFTNLDAKFDGSIAYHKNISNLLIDRDQNATYKDGHHYRFVYEYLGESVEAIIRFEAPIVEVKMPSIQLYQNGKLMEPPYILWADIPDHKYEIEFYPKDANGKTWLFDRNGDRQDLDTFVVQTDYQMEEVQFENQHFLWGEGPYHGFLENEHGSAAIDFIIKWENPNPHKELAVKVFNSATGHSVPYKEDHYRLVYDREKPEQMYTFDFTIPDGELMIQTGEGGEFTVSVERNQIAFLGMHDLPDGLKEGEYLFTYAEPNGQVISFKVVVSYGESDGDLNNEPPKNFVKITNSETGEEAPYEEEYHKLVYDYRNKEAAFTFTFNISGGTLTLVDDENHEIIIPVKGNKVVFKRGEKLPENLKTGTYKCTYQTESGTVLTFNIMVIGLNPVFDLTEVYYDRPNYVTLAVPRYPEARTYIWRVNGKYVSRSKFPKLKLDFRKLEKVTVELTMHLDAYEASYKLETTIDSLKKGKDDQ